MSKPIYLLYAISIHKNTEDDIKRNMDAENIRLNTKMDIDYYKDFLKSFHELNYETSDCVIGYFDNKETAVEYAINNAGDMNEAGCYNYAIVCQRNLNRLYPDLETEDMAIFEYNHDTDKYVEIYNSENGIICESANKELCNDLAYKYGDIIKHKEKMKGQSAT